jgi:hypothetical protein
MATYEIGVTMRLPSLPRLETMPFEDARAMLVHMELLQEETLDAPVAAFDHRGPAYHRRRARRHLKRVAELRDQLSL